MTNTPLARLVIFCALWAGPCISFPAFAGDVGKRFPSEKRTLVDAKTGIDITTLTSSSANDVKIYQTHPQWTSDGKWIVFVSDRTGSSQAFAVNEASGTIVQLTEDPDTDTSSLNLARKKNRLYYFRGSRGKTAQLIQLDLDPVLHAGGPDALPEPSVYQRVIMTLPADLQMTGGFSLDADEQHAYVGVSRDGQFEKGAIRSIDLADGKLATVLDAPFRMGHVQCNPWVPGEILYCHETGGDAPQRMWLTHADSSGTQPLYRESPQEWVTHEVIVNQDHALFILSAFKPKLRLKPTGIALINLRTQEMQLIGQVSGSGFWHCAATPDLKWAAGDTMEGDIYLINLATGERTLWSTGHRPNGCPVHAHEDFSPDGHRLLFTSGLLGQSHLMTIELPPSSVLPPQSSEIR